MESPNTHFHPTAKVHPSAIVCEGTYVRWILSLLALCWMPSLPAFGDCEVYRAFAMSRLELRLGRAIPDDKAFFKFQTIRPEDLQISHKKLERVLRLSQVRYDSSSQRAKAEDHVPGSTTEMRSGVPVKAPEAGPEWLFEIKNIPDTKNPANESPLASVYSNPKSQALLDHLASLNVPVYADPSLNLLHFEGSYNFQKHYLTLSEGATFLTLVHEASHADYHHFHIPELIKKLKRKPSAEAIRGLLEDAKYAGYGKDKLAKIVELVAKGYPEGAIDEHLAVEAEREELLKSGFDEVAVGFDGVAYARWHLMKDLANVAVDRPLTPEERTTFLRAVFENLKEGGTGKLRKQYRFGRQLAKIAKLAGEQVPDFNHAKLEVFRQKDRRDRGLAMGALAASVTAALFYRDDLGEFILDLGNGLTLRGRL